MPAMGDDVAIDASDLPAHADDAIRQQGGRERAPDEYSAPT